MKKNRFIWLIIIVFITKTTALYAADRSNSIQDPKITWKVEPKRKGRPKRKTPKSKSESTSVKNSKVQKVASVQESVLPSKKNLSNEKKIQVFDEQPSERINNSFGTLSSIGAFAYSLSTFSPIGSLAQRLLLSELEPTLAFKEDIRKETDLHKAAKKKNWKSLDTMKVTEDLIHAKNKNGETAFHCAARVGAKKFIEYLRKKQILVFYQEHQEPLLKQLLKDMEFIPIVELIALIVDYTFDSIEELATVLAMQDDSGCTPLMLALQNNHPKAAQLLIPRYKDLSIKNETGKTVEDLVQEKHFNPLKTLLKPEKIAQLHQTYFPILISQLTPTSQLLSSEKLERSKQEQHWITDYRLFSHIRDGNLNKIKEGIEHYRSHLDCQDENGDTPLHHAMRYAQFKIANYLDNTLHADRTKENNKGELAINAHQHSTGETMLHTMVQCQNLEMVSKLLTDYKANPNLTDNNEWSPLHFAAYHNYVDHAVLLIKHEASLYTQDKEGLTPLHIAIAKKHEKAALFLIKKMIDFTLKDMFGVIALHAAIDNEQENIARQIVYNEKYSPYAKGNPDNKVLSNLLAYILKTLLNPSDESRVSMKREKLISLIEEYTTSQPSILLKNHENQTALHRAAQWSSRDKADQMCTFLIHNGAKPEEQDALEHTYIKYLQDERIKQ